MKFSHEEKTDDADALFFTDGSDYGISEQGTINAYKQDNKTPQIFEIDDGNGKKVTAVAKADTVSISVKYTYIRSNPGKDAGKLKKVYLGTNVERVAVCDNGWSKVTYEYKNKRGKIYAQRT